MKKHYFIQIFLVLFVLIHSSYGASRQILSLDGLWQVAQGEDNTPPDRFGHEVPVPGLLDMAVPALDEIGTENSKNLRQSFWYRTTFRVSSPVPQSAVVTFRKVKYGYDVYLNGKHIGSHQANFTPAQFDVHDSLLGNGAENILLVRVGGHPSHPKASSITGEDKEKFLYLPGIYDSVELSLSGTPALNNVQVVPDATQSLIKIRTWISNSDDTPISSVIRYIVSEDKSGKQAAEYVHPPITFSGKQEIIQDVTVKIPEAHLWSPEDPFLYRLEVQTENDKFSTRFGMRQFYFDADTQKPMLNNKIYYLRGTNICIYRFFEDPDRKGKPWDRDWVRRVIRAFKSMNWNSCRFCIGFPPEIWYEIADEEGLMIQDEFPIWEPRGIPETVTVEELVPQFKAWMSERWNHPSVIIWDAQNESRGLGKLTATIKAVRDLDLSNRPWDCGWDPPGTATDTHEDHPYPFINMPDKKEASPFRVANFATLQPPGPRAIHNYGQHEFNSDCDNPLIVNEYGWWWLNRDGTPTRLTIKNYREFLGENATVDERRELYARYLAIMTEFYRSGRGCAGVLHFCGLGHSLPPQGDTLKQLHTIDLLSRNFIGLHGEHVGATSDNFCEIEGPTFESHFFRYVRDAFAPTGIMLGLWEPQLKRGDAFKAPVVIVNDRECPWKGKVRIQILQGQQVVGQVEKTMEIAPYDRMETTFDLKAPQDEGKYTAVAQLIRSDEEPVCSWRDIFVVP